MQYEELVADDEALHMEHAAGNKVATMEPAAEAEVVRMHPNHNNHVHVVPLRKSTGDKAPLFWMNDFMTTHASNPCVYSLGKYLNYKGLSIKYQDHLAAYSAIIESTFFSKASKNQNWIDATKAELTGLEENQTWSIVPLPPGKKAICCKLLYKENYKAYGEAERYTARLLAKGYNQK